MAPGEATADGMIWEKMWVRRPERTHLSQSEGGGYSPLAREDGTNELATHATLHPIDDDEADAWADLPLLIDLSDESTSDQETPDVLTVLIGIAVTVGAVKLAPHAARLWNETAFPALKSSWHTLTTFGRRCSDATDESATSLVVSTTTSSPDVVAVLDERGASMSSEEAQQRLIAALMARVFSDEQLTLLRDARIEEAPDPLALARVVETLTPRQVEECLRLALEKPPSWVDGATSLKPGMILESSHAGHDYVLLRSDESGKALRLTDGTA